MYTIYLDTLVFWHIIFCLHFFLCIWDNSIYEAVKFPVNFKMFSFSFVWKLFLKRSNSVKEQFINYYALKIYAFILTSSFMSSLVHISLDLNVHFQWRIYHINTKEKVDL